MRDRGKSRYYGGAYQEAIAFYDTHTPLPDKKSFTEKIVQKYTFALIVIGMLLIISFMALIFTVNTYETSAEVINIAGRQRMLTQRIAKLAHNLLHEADKEKYRKSILEAAELMEKSHDELTDSESKLNSGGSLTPSVMRLYFEAPGNIDKQVNSFLTAAKSLTAEPVDKLVRGNTHMEVIEAGAQSQLYKSLDFVVRQYQIDSESEVARLQMFAGVTLSSLLIALFLVRQFILLPVSRQIQMDADKLSFSEKKLRDITSSLGECVIVSDGDGNLTFMNPAAENLLRWTEGELIGANIEESIYYKDASGEHNPRERFLLTGSIKNGITHRVHEDTFIRKDGTPVPVSFIVTPITHKNEISGAVLAFHDISKLKEAEKERRLYAEKMERALFRAEDVLKLLSKPPGLVPFFVTSPQYRTTRTIGGGDTLRWMSFRSRYAGIYLHDVSGHDIQEILLNILATAIVDNHKINPGRKAVSTPALFFTEMNKELMKFCGDTSHYITAVYSLLDFEKREITLSLAGHPKPWLINPDGTASQVGEAGLIMGQFDLNPSVTESYTDSMIKLKTGQMLLIYSDGLMEETGNSGISFEEKFRRDIIPSLEGLGVDETYELLKSEFKAHLGGRTPDDDVSFIVIGTRPPEKYEKDDFIPGPQLLAGMKDRLMNNYPQEYVNKQNSILKSNDADANPNGIVINDVSEACTSIIEKLSAGGWPQKRIDELSIALREIVTNSFLHGNLCSDRYLVSVSHVLHGDVLEVSVSDKGIGFDGSAVQQSIKELDLLKECGRGLHMAGTYADRMFFNDSGNRCWMLFNKKTQQPNRPSKYEK